MLIEKANISDHDLLTGITKKSKTYWGYSQEQMEIWNDQLTITETYIETREVFKLLIDSKIVGYYSFFVENKIVIRFDNLFLLPEFIGKGFGKILMEDFFTRIKNTNVETIILHSEPFAENLYAKFGFIKIGQMETLIKNRYLPIMELKMNEDKYGL